MELAKRDITIQHLQNLIKNKQQLLYEKNNILHKQSKDNLYLNEIIGDYNAYFDNMNFLQTQQYNALQLLTEYIRQIIMDPASTEDIIRECKYDESLLLAEMKKLNKLV